MTFPLRRRRVQGERDVRPDGEPASHRRLPADGPSLIVIASARCAEPEEQCESGAIEQRRRNTQRARGRSNDVGGGAASDRHRSLHLLRGCACRDE